MKSKLFACGVILLVGCASLANASDRMNVSQDTLASMGLGGMQHMSDEVGMNVRGKGFATVFGLGLAQFFSNISVNGYQANSGPFRPNALAAGANGSVAIGGGLLPFLGGGFLGTGAFGGSVAFGR